MCSGFHRITSTRALGDDNSQMFPARQVIRRRVLVDECLTRPSVGALQFDDYVRVLRPLNPSPLKAIAIDCWQIKAVVGSQLDKDIIVCNGSSATLVQCLRGTLPLRPATLIDLRILVPIGVRLRIYRYACLLCRVVRTRAQGSALSTELPTKVRAPLKYFVSRWSLNFNRRFRLGGFGWRRGLNLNWLVHFAGDNITKSYPRRALTRSVSHCPLELCVALKGIVVRGSPSLRLPRSELARGIAFQFRGLGAAPAAPDISLAQDGMRPQRTSESLRAGSLGC